MPTVCCITATSVQSIGIAVLRINQILPPIYARIAIHAFRDKTRKKMKWRNISQKVKNRSLLGEIVAPHSFKGLI